MRRKIADEEFSATVAQSLSIAQIIVRLGLVPAGGNYKTVQARIVALNLDTSHFTGKGWNRGLRYRNFGRRLLTADVLVKDSTYTSSHRLRNPRSRVRTSSPAPDLRRRFRDGASSLFLLSKQMH